MAVTNELAYYGLITKVKKEIVVPAHGLKIVV
jgi:hypothetical protein